MAKTGYKGTIYQTNFDFAEEKNKKITNAGQTRQFILHINGSVIIQKQAIIFSIFSSQHDKLEN